MAGPRMNLEWSHYHHRDTEAQRACETDTRFRCQFDPSRRNARFLNAKNTKSGHKERQAIAIQSWRRRLEGAPTSPKWTPDRSKWDGGPKPTTIRTNPAGTTRLESDTTRGRSANYKNAMDFASFAMDELGVLCVKKSCVSVSTAGSATEARSGPEPPLWLGNENRPWRFGGTSTGA